jgi:hypothetical protein
MGRSARQCPAGLRGQQSLTTRSPLSREFPASLAAVSARALHAIGSELAAATAFANPMSPIGTFEKSRPNGLMSEFESRADLSRTHGVSVEFDPQRTFRLSTRRAFCGLLVGRD